MQAISIGKPIGKPIGAGSASGPSGPGIGIDNYLRPASSTDTYLRPTSTDTYKRP